MVMYRVGHKLYAIQLSKYLLIYEMLYLHILQFLWKFKYRNISFCDFIFSDELEKKSH